MQLNGNNLGEFIKEGDERLIKLTENAIKKIIELKMRENSGDWLRMLIVGGGCNGLTYRMKFVNDLKRGDIVVNSLGIKLIVDSKSALYLRGTILDYSNKMIGGGFKFTNPNAKSSCSCGESFNI